MYHAGYAEVLGDAAALARSHERRALDQAIELLTAAQQKGRRSREAIEAIFFVTKLWNILIEDLASPENGLPQQLRANLISIGIWVLKEAERVRREESEDFSRLIEVCGTIRDGL
jgi:flagellar protein FlaF